MSQWSHRLAAFKQALLFWLQLPQLLRRCLHQLFHAGGFEIITPLYYVNATNTLAQQGEFKTILQLDGDLLMFIPSPQAFAHDPQWLNLYQQAYAQHQLQLQQFLHSLNIFSILSQRFAVSIGIFSSAFMGNLTEWQLALQTLALPPYALIALLILSMVGIGAIVTLVLHYGLRPLLLRWIRRRFGLG